MSSAPLRGAAKYMEKGGGGGAPLSSAALHGGACTYGQGAREGVMLPSTPLRGAASMGKGRGRRCC